MGTPASRWGATGCLAASPLTGGTSAVVGAGLKGAVGFGLSSLASATAPDIVTRIEDFHRAAGHQLDAVVAWTLFEDERLRAELLEEWQTTGGVPAAQASQAMSDFAAFRELKPVQNISGAVAGDAGCHACHSHVSCTERCPKHLSPTRAIAARTDHMSETVR